MIRILLVDDQALVRAGFRAILELEDDLAVVGEAPDGASAVRLAAEARPDLVVMDIRMPGIDGIEATRRMRSAPSTRPGRAVLILTTFDLDEYVYAASRAGASGFLLKDAPRQQLIDAVCTVVDGQALFAPTVTRRLVERYVQGSPLSATPRLPPGVTTRETDVWRLIARGLSNAEIAALLVISETTVKSHVASLLAKLGVRDRVQAVVAAYEARLVRPGMDSSRTVGE